MRKRKKLLWNKSTGNMEDAFLEKCPRCKGFGSITQDNGMECLICHGRGRCWVSSSGWTLALWERIGSETLY